MRNAIFLAFSVSLVQPPSSTTMEPSKLRKLPYADASIKIAVNLALDQEEGVSAHLIDVESQEGIVILSGSVAKERVATLQGTVDSWTEYYAAEGEAYDAGAVLVRNRLDVNI